MIIRQQKFAIIATLTAFALSGCNKNTVEISGGGKLALTVPTAYGVYVHSAGKLTQLVQNGSPDIQGTGRETGLIIFDKQVGEVSGQFRLMIHTIPTRDWNGIALTGWPAFLHYHERKALTINARYATVPEGAQEVVIQRRPIQGQKEMMYVGPLELSPGIYQVMGHGTFTIEYEKYKASLPQVAKDFYNKGAYFKAFDAASYAIQLESTKAGDVDLAQLQGACLIRIAEEEFLRGELKKALAIANEAPAFDKTLLPSARILDCAAKIHGTSIGLQAKNWPATAVSAANALQVELSLREKALATYPPSSGTVLQDALRGIIQNRSQIGEDAHVNLATQLALKDNKKLIGDVFYLLKAVVEQEPKNGSSKIGDDFSLSLYAWALGRQGYKEAIPYIKEILKMIALRHSVSSSGVDNYLKALAELENDEMWLASTPYFMKWNSFRKRYDWDGQVYEYPIRKQLLNEQSPHIAKMRQIYRYFAAQGSDSYNREGYAFRPYSIKELTPRNMVVLCKVYRKGDNLSVTNGRSFEVILHSFPLEADSAGKPRVNWLVHDFGEPIYDGRVLNYLGTP